jgi:type II secretory pathway pseudopilin PulG
MQYKSLFVDRPSVRKNRRRRRATTLVELLVVTTLVSILMAVVGTLAIHLRQWDRHVRDHSQHSSQLTNLAETIRADIRQATGVTQPEKKVVAIAGSDSREVRYELQPGGCRRIVKAPGDKSPRIETFAIGPADSWKLETATPGRRPAYTISLERSDLDKAASQPAPFFVYAALGSDLQK